MSDEKTRWEQVAKELAASLEVVELERDRIAAQLNDFICVHHTDAERKTIKCPVCLAAQVAQLRRTLTGISQLCDYRARQDQLHLAVTCRDEAIEALNATTAPAVVPASEVWELVETLERSHRSAESDTFWHEADKALTDYHSKHPKPEAK